uniref:fibrobacter succinogenes major paralogous domain-containing protein n=1 Tax=Flavobacterium sp. TaxID=239 RepID=UPI00404AB69E
MKRKITLTTAALSFILLLFSCSSNDDSSSSNDNNPPVSNNSSQTIQIGNQIWMIKNLDVSTYRNGEIIPQVTDPSQWATLTTGAWCYYANFTGNGVLYGKLYNWYAVNDARGLAPVGYHIPTKVEFETLHTFLGGSSVAGGKMKETGTSNWLSPNTDATNSSGFTALPGGYCDGDGEFRNFSIGSYFWSSSENNENNYNRAWYCVIFYNNKFSSLPSSYFDLGMSVRCIKD